MADLPSCSIRMPSAGELQLLAAGAQRADEHDALGALRDVDEAADARDAPAELADVHVAARVDFGERQDRHVQAAAVVPVELVAGIDHGHLVARHAEVGAGGGDTADVALLHGEGDLVAQVLLGQHGGCAVGHAVAQVDDVAAAQFGRGAAGDHLALAQGQGRHVRHRHALGAGQAGVLAGGHRQALVRVGHHGIDQHPRHLDDAGVEGAGLHHMLDLRDDDAAAVSGCLRGGERLGIEALALHRDVAHLVGGGAAHDGHVDLERRVEKVLAPVDGHQLDHLVLGLGIQPPAVDARVDEGPQPDVGDHARRVAGDGPEQMRQDALRQAVRLDLPGQRHALHAGRPVPMPADGLADHARVREAVDAAALSIADAAGVNHGQPGRVLLAGKPRFQGGQHEAGFVDAAAGAVDQNRGTVGDERRGRIGGHHLGRSGGRHGATHLRMCSPTQTSSSFWLVTRISRARSTPGGIDVANDIAQLEAIPDEDRLEVANPVIAQGNRRLGLTHMRNALPPARWNRQTCRPRAARHVQSGPCTRNSTSRPRQHGWANGPR